MCRRSLTDRDPFHRNLLVEVGDHFSCDAIIFDMCISEGKATALFRNLLWRHLNFLGTLYKYLQVVFHRESSITIDFIRIYDSVIWFRSPG